VRRSLAAFALGALLLGGWAPTPVRETSQRPDEEPATPPARPFNCTERLRIPLLADIFEARWSPDSTRLTLSWYAKIPSRRSVAGYRENDTIIDTLDLRTGSVRPVGVGEHPEWSGSGRYISYWGPNGDELRIAQQDGRTVAALFASAPNVRWVGDAMYFFEKDEIRVWSEGAVRTVSRLASEFVPRYPIDDAYFSASAERFTLTRYALSGDIKRYLGVTRSGEVTPLDDGGASYVEWSPGGDDLLLRYADRVELRSPDGDAKTIALSAARGRVHGWAPDGRGLLLGRVSPTVPAGDTFDPFIVWGAPEPDTTATLPNLIGARAFSPNGAYFTGASRTGIDTTQLEVYRCGAATTGIDAARRDTETAARAERISADPHHFVRPAAGPISQFLQGSHTGIDIAAPIGSLVVAADAGSVNDVGWYPPAGGNRVCVLHGGGLETCYYHTSAALVSVGDRVERGQPLALIGLTGLTTGPHVHWEAKLFGRVVDPLAR
jgi:murein DD-endopeptidase MepM/ murein hydrolase activator NlpD